MTNPGEDDSAYERQGDARRKFWIKPLQEIDPGVAQAFLTPERLCCYFYIFQHATLNKTFTAKYNTILPRTPWDQNPRFTPRPKQDDEHRKPFYMRSAPHPPPPRSDEHLCSIRLLTSYLIYKQARLNATKSVLIICNSVFILLYSANFMCFHFSESLFA